MNRRLIFVSSLFAVLLAAGCQAGGLMETPMGDDDSSGDDSTGDALPLPDAGPPPPDAPPPKPNRVGGEDAVYKFGGIPGPDVPDTSGNGYNLTLLDPANVTFSPAGATVNAPTAFTTASPPTALMTKCAQSKELTIEAWVTPATLTPDPNSARVVALALDPANSNFNLRQQDATWVTRLRTNASDAAGNPELVAAQPVTTNTQHVVFTRDVAGQAMMYVDGVAGPAESRGLTFNNWILSYNLTVANIASLNRPWLGTLHLVAVYCKALTPAEVMQNYAAGY